MSDEKSVIKHPATTEEFETIIKSGKPVLVDFFATWCGPCQMMGPILDEMSRTYKNIDKVEIVKADIDQLKDVSMKYDIMSVPTFVLFNKKGEVAETLVGMRPTDEFEAKLNKLIEE